MDQNSSNLNPNPNPNPSNPIQSPHSAPTPNPTPASAQSTTPSTSLPKVTTPAPAVDKGKAGLDIDSHKLAQWLFWIVLAVLVVVGGFLAYKGLVERQPEASVDEGEMFSVDLASATTEVEMLPPGFPLSIPIDSTEVLESYSRTYPERNATSYNITYLTDIPADARYSQYMSFMEADGYTLSEEGTDAAARTLYGTRHDADLSIMITEEEGRTLVRLTYLERS